MGNKNEKSRQDYDVDQDGTGTLRAIARGRVYVIIRYPYVVESIEDTQFTDDYFRELLLDLQKVGKILVVAAARSRNEFRLVSARPNLLFSLHVGMSANNGLAKLLGILVVPPAPTDWPGNKSAVLWCLSYTVDCVVPFQFMLDTLNPIS